MELEEILSEELITCFSLFGAYGKSRADILELVPIWARTLAHCCDFPGWQEALREAFEEHRREETRFPYPANIRPAVLNARRRWQARQADPQDAPAQDPRYGAAALAAYHGDEKAKRLLFAKE